MDKKPDVFQTNIKTTDSSMNQLNQENQLINNDPFVNSGQLSGGELAAAAEMRRRTEEELMLRNHAMARTAESKEAGNVARAELMKEMGVTAPVNSEQQLTPDNNQPIDIPMSYEDMARFQKTLEQIDERKKTESVVDKSSMGTPLVPPTPPTPPSSFGQYNILPPEKPKDEYIEQLSKPQFNCAFDVIPLPSRGKLYKNKKPNIRIAYMSTADENILTSPNLLNSGEFLEILINRKILDNDIRYRDLLEGDRNAIMLWLRATGYGNMYAVTVHDENNIPFDTEVDLNEIKTIELTVEPDENGYFDFTLPMSKNDVKVRLLTIGDIEDISRRVEYEKNVLKLPIDNSDIYTLEKQLVSINGDTNLETIKSYSQNMRINDGIELRKFINSIDCGVDMNITVRTPGDGSVTTFLPLNLNFFWPNIGL